MSNPDDVANDEAGGHAGGQESGGGDDAPGAETGKAANAVTAGAAGVATVFVMRHVVGG